MAKTVRLGESLPVITRVRVFEVDDNGNQKEIVNKKDQHSNLIVELDKDQLGEALVEAHDDGVLNLTKMIKEIVSEPALEDQVFAIARITLAQAAKYMCDGPEKLVMKAALTYLKQIGDNEW